MKHGDSRDLKPKNLKPENLKSKNLKPKVSKHSGLQSFVPTTALPFIHTGDKIVMFDAVCKLCTGWTRFLIQHDKKGIFKLCSVQSPQGQAILTALNMPTDHFDTMLLIEETSHPETRRVYERSDAVLRIMQQLPPPLRLLSAGRVIPGAWRDWAYDQVASRRYQFFGKHAQCIIPTAAIRSRFIDRIDFDQVAF